MRQSPLTLALVTTVALTTSPALATYSILLSNVETGELGGAVTSCVGRFDLSAIFGYARNDTRAVVFFTQALFSEPNHDQALAWLNAGLEVNAVLAALTDPTFDDYAAERQYHFLPSDAEGTTWTGASTLAYAGGLDGSFGPWRYTIAGNILTGEGVLTRAEASLQVLDGSLEERLLVALEAGAQHAEGDSRCAPLPGDSAYIEVRDQNGVSRLRESVVATQPNNPLAALRRAVSFAAARDETSDGTSDESDPAGSVSPSAATSATNATADSNGLDAPGRDTSARCGLAPTAQRPGPGSCGPGALGLGLVGFALGLLRLRRGPPTADRNYP